VHLGLMDADQSSASQSAQSTRGCNGAQETASFAEDVPLLSGLEEALLEGNAAKRTGKNTVGFLRSFGRWLFANNKEPMAVRLKEESLSNDARKFIGTGGTHLHHPELRRARKSRGSKLSSINNPDTRAIWTGS